jgi:hypothetical protein
MSLSPVEFIQRYFHLPVTTDLLDNGNFDYAVWNFYTKIWHYQINGSSRAAVALHDAEAPLVAHMRKEAKANKGVVTVDRQPYLANALNMLIWGCFVGKGSPEEIALTLRLAIRYGITSVGGARDFSDRYLGMDCSGFVSNYANSEMGMKFDRVNTPASSFAPAAKRRASLDDVRSLDVLVWTDTNHVAIIDSLDQDRIDFDRRKSDSPSLNSLVCTVAEANGSRGIGSCTYTVQLMNKSTHICKVKRQEDGTTWNVRIASL